jgi:hypothetical protein
MHIKWWILGFVVLVLFVMMGHNPFEVPAGFVAEDPVKESLRKRAAGESLEGDTIFGGGTNSGFTGGPSPLLPNFQSTPTFSSPSPTMPHTAPQQAPASSPSNQPAPFQDLPTQPTNAPAASPPPGANNTETPFSPNLTLTSGKPVRFVGANVYTQDDKGNVIKHPDGVYMLMNGVRITVKDGVNQWVPLKWKSVQG